MAQNMPDRKACRHQLGMGVVKARNRVTDMIEPHIVAGVFGVGNDTAM